MWEVSHVRNGFHRNVPPNVNQTEVMENLAKTYLELYPDRGMPHYVRGAISLKSQDYESARTHIERSLSMTSRMPARPPS